MNIRKDPLVNDNYYHIFSRSIAGYEVFNKSEDFARLVELLILYRYADFVYRYSKFNELQLSMQEEIIEQLKIKRDFLVEIVAYSIMPTHLHLLLKQVVDNGISKFISRVLNSYTRYFNLKHHRTGPLWEGKFKNVAVNKDEQLLHLTRYIHLNPTSAGLVEKPEEWDFSSYNEYLNKEKNGLCNFHQLIAINPKQYKIFVNDRKSYQKELSIIKNSLIDNYGG